MDSITQLVLGGAVTALVAPASDRRKALLAGFALGTLPDLDVIPLYGLNFDAVERVTYHRGITHSIFVLAIVGWLLWLGLRRWCKPVRESPRRWFWAIELTLITHPLLDTFTIYGTQLWWPIPVNPLMNGSIFIIDPFYTLPLLAACAVTWWLNERPAAVHWLWMGILASSAYLGWSIFAQHLASRAADDELEAMGLKDAPRIVTPALFNTVTWRIVAMKPDGFVEGFYTLGTVQGVGFKSYTSNNAALAAVAEYPEVERLMWFTSGFMKAERRGEDLVLSDLRMGAEPFYSFNYLVAHRDETGHWQPVKTRSER